MRNKKMLTVTLCLVLAVASPVSTQGNGFAKYSLAEEPESSGEKEKKNTNSEETRAVEPTAQKQSAEDKSTEKNTEQQKDLKQPTTEAQTQPVTEAQTQPATEAQTQPATEAQTQPATEAQTQPATEAQTQPATEAQTQPATEAQTQPATEAQTQPATEAQTQPTTEVQTQPATEAQTQPSTEAGTESQTQPASEQLTEAESDVPSAEPETSGEGQTESEISELETKKETEEKTEKETETEEETESESETNPEEDPEDKDRKSPYETNEELIAHQNIVVPPVPELEFRFTQIDKQYAVVNCREGCEVYEEKAETSRAVGELPYYGLCCVIADGNQEWVYIESGNVRGFVKAEYLAMGDVALRIVKVRGEDQLPQARLLVARTENDAYTYTKTTVKEVLAEKEYAIAEEELDIYEQKKTSARVTGRIPEDGLCYVLEDSGSDWAYVESGNARGFVKTEDLLKGKAAEKKVEEVGESNLSLAETLIEPENNKACYYTLTSVKKASQSALTRESMVDFALQFLGNPYVWGGTSLTTGADCSGFVQSIYAHYGYSLPRVACDQAGYGMQIPVASALPGDLIFYAKEGYVYHVSMYIGNGQVVHAAGRKLGIITSGISGNAVWATRVIPD